MSDPTRPAALNCSDCERETTVTRDDVADFHPDLDSRGALTLTLQKRG